MTKKTKTRKSTKTQPVVDTKSGSLGAIVDSLIPLTAKELEPAHAGATYIQGDAGGFALDLGMEQPNIRTFALNIPATPYQDLTERKKQLGCARRVCLALKERFGWIPVLKEKDLVAGEAQVKALLADPLVATNLKATAVVKFAETGLQMMTRYLTGCSSIRFARRFTSWVKSSITPRINSPLRN